MSKILIQRQPQELKEPTVEECRGWIEQGVGKYFKALLFERLEDLKDNFVNGDYTGVCADETAQKNAEAIGRAQAIAEVILTLEEMCIEETEDQ